MIESREIIIRIKKRIREAHGPFSLTRCGASFSPWHSIATVDVVIIATINYNVTFIIIIITITFTIIKDSKGKNGSIQPVKKPLNTN